MSKLLFYSGIVFAVAVSAAAGIQGLSFLWDHPAFARTLASSSLTLVLLAATAPVAALLTRMASLIAARNLFAGLFAIMTIAAGFASAVFACGARLQSGIPLLEQHAVRTEIRQVTILVFGFFLAVLFVAIAPYFRVHSNRFLSISLCTPAALYAWMLLGRQLPPDVRYDASPALFALLAVVSFVFAAIATHCLRHRHLFLEVTSLRELLDGRVNPSGRAEPRFGFGRPVAFE